MSGPLPPLQKEVFRFSAISCPVCAWKMDASSGFEGDPAAPPQEGSVTVCQRCTSVLVVGPENSCGLLTPAYWAEFDDEDKERLDALARATEHWPRKRPETQIDTLVNRSPNDWRAGVTLKNGLFVVSPPFNTRKKAIRALRGARNGITLGAKFTNVQDDFVPAAQRGWYGQAYVMFFGREDAASEHFGPCASQEEITAIGEKRLVTLAKELGLSVGAILHMDMREQRAKGAAEFEN